MARIGDIGIVGAGRLGSTLALALTRAGHGVRAVAASALSSAQELARRLPSARACAAEEVVASCELVFLTVPDDALSALVARLPFRSEQRVVHCSGALGLELLAPVRASGGFAGCMHPLQSFPERFGVADRLRGIAFGIEGDGPLFDELARLVEGLGSTHVSLGGVDRALYHTAAVFASNYVVALLAAATESWALSGLPEGEARSALAPLTAGAIDNALRLPLGLALTGPVARGDVETVATHLDALAVAPELRELYRRLATRLLALPLTLREEPRVELERLLRAK